MQNRRRWQRGLSLNTQHIVADETGVTDVVDPLAGSYFVEYLTNKVEEEAYRIWNKIEDLGRDDCRRTERIHSGHAEGVGPGKAPRSGSGEID